MAGYGTKQQHMDWAVQRALAIYDQGDHKTAVDSFISDMDKHRETEWVAQHPLALMTLESGLGSREDFEKAMRGFNI